MRPIHGGRLTGIIAAQRIAARLYVSPSPPEAGR